jgi:divalent metal cation (Fe/Co/Zn/Cd) transporter
VQHVAELKVPDRKSQQIAWLQGLTLAWMTIECSMALSSAYASRSVALLAFGSDSAVEFLSATVVLLQFVPAIRVSSPLAARLASILLFALACVIGIISAYSLAYHVQPEVSPTGIAITAAALIVMPLLGTLKRKKAKQLGDRALAADAIQSLTCGYLAAITLLSLIMNAAFQIRWLDAVAGLFAIPILVVEGRRAWKGDSCGCCS